MIERKGKQKKKEEIEELIFLSGRSMS